MLRWPATSIIVVLSSSTKAFFPHAFFLAGSAARADAAWLGPLSREEGKVAEERGLAIHVGRGGHGEREEGGEEGALGREREQGSPAPDPPSRSSLLALPACAVERCRPCSPRIFPFRDSILPGGHLIE